VHQLREVLGERVRTILPNLLPYFSSATSTDASAPAHFGLRGIANLLSGDTDQLLLFWYGWKTAPRRATEAPFELIVACRGVKVDLEKSGRARMMTHLPRHRKQIADANFLAMTDLLEAYGKAAMTRDELREQAAPDLARLKQYEDLCRKLEDDILIMLGTASPLKPR